MSDRLFLDTNIVVYSFDKMLRKRPTARSNSYGEQSKHSRE